MKNKLFIITIFLTLLGNASNAENFNYDYIEFKVGTTNSDATEKEIYAVASKSINENISFRGGLYYYTGDWTTSSNFGKQVGKGFNLDSVYNAGITSKTDLVISAGYSFYSIEASSKQISGVISSNTNTNVDTNIYHASIGIRQKILDSIEMEAHYRGIDVEKSTSSVTQGNLILMNKLSKNTSIGIDYSWNITRNDFNRTMVILRREF
ncbi:hypothetical protein N9X67_03225 [Amylibacter sp.]|nr:hypothetical protein [Amylibacter sp.]